MPRGSHVKTAGQTGVCAFEPCGKTFEKKQDWQRYCCTYHKVEACRRGTFERRVKEAVRERLKKALKDLDA